MARQKYPSDHRRWFRVAEDILDDPRLNGEEWVWGAYFRILAMLNRTKSRDGTLRVSPRTLGVMMGRSRGDIAAKRLASLAHLGLIAAARYADFWLILVGKWPEHQGFTPTELRPGSVQTPSPTPKTTPTPTPTTEREPRPPAAPVSRRKQLGETLAPANLPEAEMVKLVDWGARNNFTTAQCLAAWEIVHDWSHGGGNTKADWLATTRNGMRKGWALRAPPGPNGSPNRPQTFNDLEQENQRDFIKRRLGTDDEPEGDLLAPGGAESRLPVGSH